MTKWQKHLQQLLTRPDGRQLRLALVGVGQTLMGDDGAGTLIARQIGSCLNDPSLLVVAAEHAPENCMGVVTRFRPDVVLFVDAVRAGGRAGDILWLTAEQAESAGGSTHTLSLAILGEYLARITGADAYILGIEPGHVAFGEEVSAPVAAAIDEVAATLADYWRSAATASSAMAAGEFSVEST